MGVFEGEFDFKPIKKKVDPKELPFWKRWTAWIFDWDSDTTFLIQKEFYYTDDRGVTWEIGPGDVFDGASIPRLFWSVVGSPMQGDYMIASAFHDVYLDRNVRSSEQVHEVFCEIMKYTDVPALKRKIMCWAVKVWGPKFEV